MTTTLAPTQDTDVSTQDAVNKLIDGQAEAVVRPFQRWHLRKKFQVMEALFRKYLTPEARFADIACGRGDGLVLASMCMPAGEIWGVDINQPDLDTCARRVPRAVLHIDDMHNPASLPKEYFDVVHEYGATFFSRQWDVLVRGYMSLLRDGGILLWELPQRWSLAHIGYLLTVAPKNSAADTKFRRILRSFSPAKYHFESDAAIAEALDRVGCEYEIVERVPIWNFYPPPSVRPPLDWMAGHFGEGMFERLDKTTRSVWNKDAGYYLVIRKKSGTKKQS